MVKNDQIATVQRRAFIYLSSIVCRAVVPVSYRVSDVPWHRGVYFFLLGQRRSGISDIMRIQT